MLGRLLALFLIVPVVELALLIRLGGWIGFWPTVALIALTGTAGAYLAKKEGLSVWKRFNDQLRAGGLPGRELLDGVIILVSGALLITPGVFTDFIGFLGLIPVTRKVIRNFLKSRIQAVSARGTVHASFGGFYADVERPDVGRDTNRNQAESDGGRWQGNPKEMPEYRDPGSS